MGRGRLRKQSGESHSAPLHGCALRRRLDCWLAAASKKKPRRTWGAQCQALSVLPACSPLLHEQGLHGISWVPPSTQPRQRKAQVYCDTTGERTALLPLTLLSTVQPPAVPGRAPLPQLLLAADRPLPWGVGLPFPDRGHKNQPPGPKKPTSCLPCPQHKADGEGGGRSPWRNRDSSP